VGAGAASNELKKKGITVAAARVALAAPRSGDRYDWTSNEGSHLIFKEGAHPFQVGPFDFSAKRRNDATLAGSSMIRLMVKERTNVGMQVQSKIMSEQGYRHRSGPERDFRGSP
jgi:hypothetical protein